MPLLSLNNTSNQPRRSKSFSSLKRHQLKHAKSFNTSELAHREALTAAELAFERARERFAVSNELEDSITTNINPASHRSNDPQLNRKQSIRFTGANAVKTRELPNTRREVPDDRDLRGLKEQSPRLEYVESSVASEPSSYRRLRKAKSMFNPRKTTLDFSPNITNSRRGGPFKRDSIRSSESHHTMVRPVDHHLRRSFSFLRGVTDRLSTNDQSFVADDAAVQIARDQYLRQLEEQRLIEQPSFGKFARRRQSSQGLRRTVRTSSNTSNITTIQSPLVFRDEPKVKSLSRKARTVSHSLKRTLKKVFGRPPPDNARLPEQHLSATKAHYGENWDGQYEPLLSPDVELLRRVDSRESILPEVIGFHEDNQARAESIRSSNLLDEGSNLQSRVTSWSNSTTGNTLNTPQFVERKRLSVIKEDGGPYQPSSSASRYIDQKDGYSAFRQPARLDNVGPAAAQRIYSALQREIQKGDQDAAGNIDEPEADSDSGQSTSRHSRVTLGRTSNGNTTYDGPPLAGPQHHGNTTANFLFSTSNPTTDTDELPSTLDGESSWLPGYQQTYDEPFKRPTPQQIAHFNEPEVPSPRKPLREVKSAFFPSESRIERRAISPYRRAMYDNNEGPSDALLHESSVSPDPWLPRSTVSVRKSSTTRSDSVYSRTEGGHSPIFMGSSLSLPGTESNGEPGTAVIIPSRHYSPSFRVPVHTPWRKASDQSSGEWKNWMASEVSHFENHVEQYDGIYNAFPVKESGHRRENAQLDGEENVVGRVMKSIHATKQPFGMIHTNASVRPALQESMARSNIVNSSLHDVRAFGTEASTRQKENTSNMYAQAPLNTQCNDVVDEAVSKSSHKTFTGSSIRASSSRTALHSYNENNSPLSSPNNSNSPDRAERLRRLAKKSSHSLNMTAIPPKVKPAMDKYQGKQTIFNDSPRAHEGTEQSILGSSSQNPGKESLVGELLKRRRSNMRISDESGGDPAFL